ncbi:hypothetical protein K523DRAFT_130461 [Schizophyllum commune Tattone D]|nr:hypothetical protein K523DRAFT_130461 [Schizophyllum commune Tattone D]
MNSRRSGRRPTTRSTSRGRPAASARSSAPSRATSTDALPSSSPYPTPRIALPRLSVPLTREISYHDEPPAETFRVGSPTRARSRLPSRPARRTLSRAPSATPSSPHLARPAIRNLIHEEAHELDLPPYEARTARPPAYLPGERGPHELFPITESRASPPEREEMSPLTELTPSTASTPPPCPPSPSTRDAPFVPRPFPPAHPLPVPSVPIDSFARSTSHSPSSPPGSPSHAAHPLPSATPPTVYPFPREDEAGISQSMRNFAARAYPFIRMGDTGLAPPPEGRLLTIPGTTP